MHESAGRRGKTFWILLPALCSIVVGLSSVGGLAQNLPLVLPCAIAFDSQGNLYIADTGNHVVRKLAPAGAVTVVAGIGVQGFGGDTGLATTAQLDSPAGLAVDAAGNLYIADSHNHRLRLVAAASGVITTIAGSATPGFSGDGGLANAASLDLPTALALNPSGDLYVADTSNHRIRRIAAATGLITTIAGDGVEGFSGDHGPATAAAIDSPTGLAVDAAGNLYIADTHNGRVRQVAASTGLISTVAGAGVTAGNLQAFAGDGGAATAAALALPRGLTLDSAGNLYVADSANHRIRRISISGTITTVAGEGTETFAGEGTPAVSASLDSPRSVAISPAGLVTLTDSGNQRVRQLDATPAPGPDIHTMPWTAGTTPGTLTLNAPAVVTYGSGSLTATLSSATLATGNVTLADTGSGAAVAIGTATLDAGNSTSFAIGALGTGTHTITATYLGDANHAGAQSAAVTIKVTALVLTATASPVSILYGQAIVYGQAVPTLSGSLSGVLPQDAGKVTAAFTTGAATFSPTGIYPISANLLGSAAGNYSVAVTPANLTIAKAPTLTTISASTATPTVGLPITLNAQAASTTSGVPTGSMTLLDGASILGQMPLSATGGASLATSSLATSSHALTAVYPGDGNFLPSSSTAVNVTVGAGPDFSLASTGANSQTVPAGTATTFNFAVATQGASLSSPILLAVQGLPPGATASINPSSIPRGGAVTNFVLTIQTPLALLDQPVGPKPARTDGAGIRGFLAVFLLPLIGWGGRSTINYVSNPRYSRRSIATRTVLKVGFCISLASLASGCGDRVNTASELSHAITYTITVTGTATGPAGSALQHSANVTLEVL